MYKVNILIFLFAVLFSWKSEIVAQQTGNNFRAEYQYRIKRTSESIKIDGVLKESVWETAQNATNFFYITPVAEKQVEKEDQTEVRMTYNDRYIYVAVICHGKKPYLVPSLKRDGNSFWGGEVFMLSFDPGNERTTGYGFATNSAGVQYDNQLAGDLGTRSGGGSNGFNTAWNNKWQCETKV